MSTLILKVSTLEDLEAALNKSYKSLKQMREIHESHWKEDIHDHAYPQRRHLEEREVIDARKAKEMKKYVLGEIVDTWLKKCRHLKIMNNDSSL